MDDSEPETMVLPDGRRLAYKTHGDEGGSPLVFHHEIPGTCLLSSLFDTVAREQNVRVIAPTGPGYGGLIRPTRRSKREPRIVKNWPAISRSIRSQFPGFLLVVRSRWPSLSSCLTECAPSDWSVRSFQKATAGRWKRSRGFR